MKLPHRKVLTLAAGAVVSPAYIHSAGAETGRPLSANADHRREFPSPVTFLTSRAGSCRTYTG